MKTYDSLKEHESHELKVLLRAQLVRAGLTHPSNMVVLICVTDDKELDRYEEPKELRVVASDGGAEFECPYCGDTPFRYTEDDGFTKRHLEIKYPSANRAISTFVGNDTWEGDEHEWMCRNCVRPVKLPEGYELDYA